MAQYVNLIRKFGTVWCAYYNPAAQTIRCYLSILGNDDQLLDPLYSIPHQSIDAAVIQTIKNVPNKSVGPYYIALQLLCVGQRDTYLYFATV